MRLLICGDRNWTDNKLIAQLILEYAPKVLIHGNARGADKIAGAIAEALGIEVVKFPANWSIYHRAAGPIRNQQMLDEGKPDLVLAFHDNLASSKGTRDMLNRADDQGFKWKVIRH